MVFTDRRLWVVITAGVAVGTFVTGLFVAPALAPREDPPGDPFWLRVELALERDAHSLGETVWMNATLYNPGTRDVTLFFATACWTALFVYDRNGALVSGDFEPGCALVTAEFTIAPGETLEFPLSWNQLDNEGEPVVPGPYILTAYVQAQPFYSASALVGIMPA